MNDVVEHHAPSVAIGPLAVMGTNPGDLLAYAMQSGAPMETLEKFMALKERWEANEARKAYVAAMAEFKRNPPEILKDKHVEYTGVSYDHASLGNVTAAICAGLAQHGFSHRWDVKQEAKITVICTITHALGHAESVQMTAVADDSGKKNSIQQVASTVTYLQRYTLLAATGLAVQDGYDDDGRGSEDGRAEAASNGNGGTRKPAASAPVEKLPYGDDDFSANFPAWKNLVLKRKKTPEEIIATLESKHMLLDKQRQQIRALAPAAAAAGSAA